MSFDARSLERLQQLGRSLPQPLPQPPSKADSSPAPTPSATAKRHRVETETDPQALFHELMQVSPDGTVPPHLMDRLRQAEADAALAQPAGPQQPANQPQRRGRPQQPSGQRRPAASGEELELYSAFQDLLHLESDELEELNGS